MQKRFSALLTPAPEEKIPDNRRRSYAFSPDSFNHPPFASAPRRTSDPAAFNPASQTLRQPLVDTPQLRKSPAQLVQHHIAPQPSLQQIRRDFVQEGLQPVLAPPPPVYSASGSQSRSSSADRSRPASPSSRSSTPTERRRPRLSSFGVQSNADKSGDEDTKRRSTWFGKGKDSEEKSPTYQGPHAWIAGHPQRLPYDLKTLWSGKLLPELSRDEDANCYLHLWPRDSNKGPSFRVDSTIFAASPALTKMAFGDLYSASSSSSRSSRDRGQPSLDVATQGLSLSDNNAATSSFPGSSAQSTSSMQSVSQISTTSERPSESRIYFSLKLSQKGLLTSQLPATLDRALREDVQTLVDMRNVFAFLCGQSLVATPLKPTLFHIFMTIASTLKSYEFSNVDASTFGEVASESFDCYLTELRLADVRSSPEKAIDGLVLGERMRSVTLYNEAFTHAAGQYAEVIAINSPKWQLVSPITQNRLARASMDLEKRLESVRIILTDFDFPALFTGIMNSKTSEERKEGVKFEGWRTAFLAMRKHVIGAYQKKYGHWPPRASSKKNDLETSGLNRKVLQGMYQDMTGMYDLVANRVRLTTRLMEGNDLGAERDEPMVRALRSVLAEYDRSSPPVKPPIPFDLPLFPGLVTSRSESGTDVRVLAKAAGKKLKDDEITHTLRLACNEDAPVSEAVDSFRDFERHAAHGKDIHQICDQRIGHWIFIYVVLQALPMLVCDAPGLKYSSGVEYFLCEPPRSGVPWVVGNVAGQGTGTGGERRWFTVAEGGGVVNLPSDIVEHGVEGIFRRSHCWVMAEKWSASNPALNTALHRQESINAMTSARLNDRMQPPTPTMGEPQPFLRPGVSRGSSPSRVAKRKSYLGLGLEALPLPAGMSPGSRSPSQGNMVAWPAGTSPQGSRAVTPQHTVDTSKTFDAILGGLDHGGKKGKKK